VAAVPESPKPPAPVVTPKLAPVKAQSEFPWAIIVVLVAAAVLLFFLMRRKPKKK
jgi:hypothetical protein